MNHPQASRFAAGPLAAATMVSEAHRSDAAEDSAWRLEDLDWQALDRSRVGDDEELFFLLCGASFVEIASDMYTRNLAVYCADEPEITDWLSERWARDEVRHGTALKTYVQRAWPDFPWQRAYDAFFEEYSRVCGVEAFAPSQGLEMVARCVVETGTATYYRSLRDLTDEPVLRRLTDWIGKDEVRHYKHFHGFFRRYNQTELRGRLRVFLTIARRLLEMREGDATCALWHAFHVRYPEEPRGGERFNAILAKSSQRVKQHFPHMMAVKMLLKPLSLPAPFRILHFPLAKLAQYVILR